eukprot:TRINITY_DN106976_c0_g1_i1.p1 TRINITY_DN106976_c0_g1~~TRINITY_DN106976_c0_g1_i1.p1  ORF type:complete len:348 (-),score=69.92 TRINITY_DN106976_c0_g1_i1:80-1123(-)
MEALTVRWKCPEQGCTFQIMSDVKYWSQMKYHHRKTKHGYVAEQKERAECAETPSSMEVGGRAPRRTLHDEGLLNRIRQMPAASEEEISKRGLVLKGFYAYLTRDHDGEKVGAKQRSPSGAYSYWLAAKRALNFERSFETTASPEFIDILASTDEDRKGHGLFKYGLRSFATFYAANLQGGSFRYDPEWSKVEVTSPRVSVASAEPGGQDPQPKRQRSQSGSNTHTRRLRLSSEGTHLQSAMGSAAAAGCNASAPSQAARSSSSHNVPREHIQHIKEAVFLPLLRCAACGVQGDIDIYTLQGVGHQLGMEDLLLNMLPDLLRKPPKERGDFGNKVLHQFEAALDKHI